MKLFLQEINEKTVLKKLLFKLKYNNLIKACGIWHLTGN